MVTLFAALLYSSTLPDLYQSDMLIAVDPQRVPDAFVRSTVTLGTDRRLDALKVKVLSRTALEQLIEEFDLYPEERATMPIEDVVAKMRDNIDMVMQIPRPRWGEEPQPTAFRVQFTYPDPEMATEGHAASSARCSSNRTSATAARWPARPTGSSRTSWQTRARSSRSRSGGSRSFRQQHGKELPTQMHLEPAGA